MSDWLGINSSNYESSCGSDDMRTLSEALGGTDVWQHDADHDGGIHFFVVDLGENDGKFYNLTKFKGRSYFGDFDPIDVDIYVSETNGNWGSAVATGISSWQDTEIFVEELATTKTGRFIRVVINQTEDLQGIIWGRSGSAFTIFDAYGSLIVPVASEVIIVSNTSGTLRNEKYLASIITEDSYISGAMFTLATTVVLRGSTDIISGVTGEFNFLFTLVRSEATVNSGTSGSLSLWLTLVSNISEVASTVGYLELDSELVSSIAEISVAVSSLDSQPGIGSNVVEIPSVAASLSFLDVLTNLISYITEVVGVIGFLDAQQNLISSSVVLSSASGNLDILYHLRQNTTAKKWYDMLQRKGIDAIVRTYPDATFNPSTNKTTLSHVVDFPVKIIPIYKNREGYKPAELITSGNGLSGIVNYNLRFDVKVGLKLIIGSASKVWTVTGITEIKDSTGILLYTIEVEAGD